MVFNLRELVQEGLKAPYRAD